MSLLGRGFPLTGAMCGCGAGSARRERLFYTRRERLFYMAASGSLPDQSWPQ